MRINIKMLCAAAAVAAAVAFVAGCSCKDADRKNDALAEKIAELEKDMSRLKGEVRELRHRIEMEAKMHPPAAMRQSPHRPGRPGPYARGTEEPQDPKNMRKGEYPPRHPPMMREDPAKMTPEQRRAWHEERRRMREERMRQKISEPGKQTNPETKGENK